MARLRLLPLALLLAPACAELSPIDAGVCGNLIVEGDEQCDGDDARGRCRPPSDDAACRYDCSSDGVCPDDLVCGTGQICHQPGVCGNGVVEGAEHCDGPGADETSCREAGQAGECKFDCTTGACPSGFKCLETGICDNVDVCGNAIAEPSNAEDCDGGDVIEGFVCGAPGTAVACRYDCGASGDCPAGFGCGLDGVCRRPAGTFEPGDNIFGETLGVVLAEFDGDGRRDLLRVTPAVLEVSYFDDAAHQDQIATLATAATAPTVGDMTGDGLDDIAFRVPSKFITQAGEMAVLTARADRTLISMAHATENLPGYIAAVDALPPASTGDLLFFNGTSVQGYSFTLDLDPGNNDNVLFGTTQQLATGFPGVTNLLGVASAYLEPNPDCQHTAAAWRNVSSIRVVRPCVGSFNLFDPPWNDFLPPVTVSMPATHRPWATSMSGPNRGGAVFFGELNGDGNVDVLVPTVTDSPVTCSPASCTFVGCVDDGMCLAADDDCTCSDCVNTPECVNCNGDGICDVFVETCMCSDCANHPICPEGDAFQVAYGLGNGTFDSSPFAVVPDNTTSVLPFRALPNFQCPLQYGPLGAPLLAMAELNGDGFSDFVNGLGVYVSDLFGDYLYTLCPVEPWQDAVVADFDGSGTLDIIASTEGATALEFASGVGDGTFTTQLLPIGGFAKSMVAADFDGDNVKDLALLRETGPNQPVDVMVAFGRALQAPEPAVVVTRVSGATQLAAGRFLLGDGAADLAITTSTGTLVTFLRGSATRQFLSTFVLRESDPAPYATFTGVKSLEAIAYGRFAVPQAAPMGTTVTLAALTVHKDASQSIDHVATSAIGNLSEVRNAGPFECIASMQNCEPWRLAALDLDDDGLDSIIAFRDDELAVFDQAAQPQEIQRLTPSLKMLQGRNPVHGAIVGRPQVVDVDADGAEDVAILSNDGDVHVFFNEGNGQLSLDASAYVVIAPADASRPFLAFTFANVAGDGGLELITLDTTAALAHTVEAASRSFAPPEDLGIRTGDVIASGDIDGDGVVDLVVGDALGVSVIRGKAVLP